MIHGKKLIVVMPAYNAEKTLVNVYNEVPYDYVDEIILVDDASRDNTVSISKDLGITTIIHEKNQGYGANQKSCYKTAITHGADVVVMVHPDYQYTPKLIVAMGSLIAIGQFDIVLGSRILSGGAIKGGMPLYKYISNRALTLFQNLMTGAKLSEYHTGYRAFSKEVLLSLPLIENSNDFLFDNQMLIQAINFGFTIGEISCPTKYFQDSSSINLSRSIVYGIGVIVTTIQFMFFRMKLSNSKLFAENSRKLEI